jgi:hypothetical protein
MMGFDFGSVKKAPISQPDDEEPVQEEKKPQRTQKPPKEESSIAAVMLLGEALPYLRKYASYKMNWNGTKQGEECQKLVERIDDWIKKRAG